MEDFTPVSGLIGGLLIGLAVVLLMLLNGRIAGISNIVGGLVGLPAVLGFVAAMLVGMALHAWISGERTIRASSSPEAGDAAADPR